MRKRYHLSIQVMALMAVVLSVVAVCLDQDSGCRDEEGLASTDSVAILDFAHAGGNIRVRISGLVGCCSSLRRVDQESRGDTVLLRPIEARRYCPEDPPCPPCMLGFVDTVRVSVPQATVLWVRAEGHGHRVVDSTIVLPARSDMR